MNIRNYQAFPGLSQETGAFRADLYDGETKLGEVCNHGEGGAHIFFPYSLEKKVLAFATESKEIRARLAIFAAEFDLDAEDLAEDADFVVEALIAEQEVAR